MSPEDWLRRSSGLSCTIGKTKMKCNWDMSDKDSTHIPKKCGKDAIVIYQGPRDFQIVGLCKAHQQRGFEIYGAVGIGWKQFTPDGFEVFRVMSE